MTRPQVDRGTVSEREWLAFLHDEIDEIWRRVRKIEQSRGRDLAELDRRLDALREELRAHALSITREGWRYILGGAVITAVGITLALFA